MNKNVMFTLCKKQISKYTWYFTTFSTVQLQRVLPYKKALKVLYIWRGFFYFSLKEIKH